MACKAQQQQQIDFQRFVDLLPKKPYCSDDLAYGVRIRPRLSAIRYRYIQPNPPALQHWIMFDLDYDAYVRLFPWEDVSLPTPNIIAYNRENGHCHILYAIESVCTSPDARPKPLHYLAAIQRAYTAALSADSGYAGLLTKNPLCSHWHSAELHDHVYSLGELADYVTLPKLRWDRRRAANDDHEGLGRNCAIFHRLRYWAYDHVNDYRGTVSYNQWMSEVLSRCEGFNDFKPALSYSEVKSTAKSVGKWVWKHYTGTGSGKRRGAMAEQFQASQLPLSLETKQRLSARRTHDTRRTATEQAIIDAIATLQEQGKRATVRAIAEVTGFSKTTVQANKP